MLLTYFLFIKTILRACSTSSSVGTVIVRRIVSPWVDTVIVRRIVSPWVDTVIVRIVSP